MNSIKAFLKKPSGKILLVIGLILLLLPEVVKIALIKAADSNGIGEASIDDVDLNLFTGSAALNGVTLLRENQQKLVIARLAADVSWLQLVRGIIYVEQFSLEGTRLAVVQQEDGNWEVVIPLEAADETTPPAEDAETSIALPRIAAASMQLVDVEVTIDSPLTSGVLSVDSLQLYQLSTWMSDDISLSLVASWNKAPFKLDLTASPWVDEPSLEASLDLNSVNIAAALPIDGKEEAVSAILDVALNLKAERNKNGDISANVEGELSIEQLAASYKVINLASENLAWQGKANFFNSQENVQYAVNGDFSSSGLQVSDSKQQLQLLAWQQLDLQQFSLDQALTVGFEELVIKGLDLIREDQQPRGKMFAGLLDIQQLELLTANHLSIELIDVQEGQFEVVLAEDAQLEIQNVLASTMASLVDNKAGSVESEGDADQSSTETSASPFTLTLETVNVASGSQLSFTDERFSVPVKQQLNVKTLQLTGLDQQQIEQPASFILEGSLGEFSSIDIKGQLKPFAEKLWLDINGDIESIPLHDLSPYSEAYIGYHLSRGQYDHQFEITIADDDIQLNNKLLLRKLSLKSVDPDKPQPMAQELDVPLGLALDMLRDSDDNITLEVPIKGRMDDPDVDISQVVNKALATALKSGASNFLKLALQPYGAVLMAAEFVGDQMSAISLDPIVFGPGSGDVSAEHQDYVVKIAGLMKQRPKLDLTLCANANEQDKNALQLVQPEQPITDELLVNLADQRGTQLKRLFLDSGIESKRIFICQPVYDAGAKNGVTLKM